MNKQKLKNALKYGAVITLAVAAGSVTMFVVLRNKEENDWDMCRITPEHLQQMIDLPDSVVAFKDANVMVGSTVSSEI